MKLLHFACALALVVCVFGQAHPDPINERAIETLPDVEGSGEEIEEGSGEETEGPDRSLCPQLLDVVFLVDGSGSQRENFESSKNWLLNVVEGLDVNRNQVRTAMIQYAGFPFTEYALSTYINKADVQEHLKRHTAYRSGVTRTGAALQRAQIELFRANRGARHNAHKAVVIFTDGLSLDAPQLAAQELRDLGVKIYAVVLPADAYMPEIEGIVGNDNNIYSTFELDRLQHDLAELAEKSRVCPWDSVKVAKVDFGNLELPASDEIFSQQEDAETQATELYDVTDREEDGNTEALHVELATETITTTTTAPTPTRRVVTTQRTTRAARVFNTVAPLISEEDYDGCPIDILVILDGSGSMQENYEYQKQFVASIASGIHMPIQRLAIVQFAGRKLQKTEVGFDDFKSTASLMKEFDQRVRHFTGTTYLGKAIEHARTVLAARDRQRVLRTKTYVLVVSDGYTQDFVDEPLERLRAENPNLELYAIALGQLNNERLLELMTGDSEHLIIGIDRATAFRDRLLRRMDDC